MESRLTLLAAQCLARTYDGSTSFPAIIAALADAGFEGYEVNYRRGTVTYYLPSGASVELTAPKTAGTVAAAFEPASVAAAVREAQQGAPGYTYVGFCEKVKAAGCAGYLVSFTGRRVVYFGRTAELHVEHFPQRN